MDVEPRIGAIGLLKTLLTLVLLAASLWIAIAGVVPPPQSKSVGVAEPTLPPEITWRRTAEGWVLAQHWLSPEPPPRPPARPPIHPFTTLPLVVAISLVALIVGHPRPCGADGRQTFSASSGN